MKSVIRSDIGKHRDINEDYGLITKINDTFVYIVADGMGGHLAGEVASKMAIEKIVQYLEDNSDKSNKCVRMINDAVIYANDQIFEKSQNPEYKNMGTTCELVLVYDNKAYVGHVGDSRVYKLSKGELTQITRDHSLINDLVDSGSISKDEAKSLPQKNIITRALGSEEEISVDILEFDLSKDDIILICTDGVTGGLSDEILRKTLSTDKSLDKKADEIIQLSNDAGGFDNSTVILAEMRWC